MFHHSNYLGEVTQFKNGCDLWMTGKLNFISVSVDYLGITSDSFLTVNKENKRFGQFPSQYLRDLLSVVGHN